MSSNVGFRQVGEFIPQRQMIRSVRNPLDQATIVSIFPKEINEVKETIQPGKFHIPKGSYEEPAVVTVGPSSWWRDIDVDQPMLEITNSAVVIAQSIIVDYSNGLLGCDMGSSMPGLFFIAGEVSKLDVILKYKMKLAEAKVKQDNWYRILAKIADSLWARSNGNPLVIWDEMRLAAQELGLDSKPWIKDFQSIELIRCFACGVLRNPDFPICSACRVIDSNHPLAKGLKFATQQQ